MATERSPIGELAVLSAANDLDRGDLTELDLTGSAGCVILQLADGTAGTVGVDNIEFSRDGGDTFAVATAANIGQGHAGLILEDGTAAAVADAALNAAGVEPSGAAVFTLGPVDGPFLIRANGTADWTTGAPSIKAFRIG